MTVADDKAGRQPSALVSLLDLEPLATDLFRGRSPNNGWKRVFGGQVLGQSLAAAQRTVNERTVSEPRSVHSIHAYFLLAGDPAVPIDYRVERVRDGGSFTTRRVEAVQHGKPIYVMMASFQRTEDSFDHQATMPGVPPPESLPSEHDLQKRLADSLPQNARTWFKTERPVEMRLVEYERYRIRDKSVPTQHVWIRARGTLPDDPAIHHCVLAYASDFTLLDTALIAHGKLLFDTDIQMASLDHALWIHRPFRADAWMLYAQDSPSASGSRGFSRGSLFDRTGRLIASVTQEGLIRKRETSFVLK